MSLQRDERAYVQQDALLPLDARQDAQLQDAPLGARQDAQLQLRLQHARQDVLGARQDVQLRLLHAQLHVLPLLGVQLDALLPLDAR